MPDEGGRRRAEESVNRDGQNDWKEVFEECGGAGAIGHSKGVRKKACQLKFQSLAENRVLTGVVQIGFGKPIEMKAQAVIVMRVDMEFLACFPELNQ